MSFKNDDWWKKEEEILGDITPSLREIINTHQDLKRCLDYRISSSNEWWLALDFNLMALKVLLDKVSEEEKKVEITRVFRITISNLKIAIEECGGKATSHEVHEILGARTSWEKERIQKSLARHCQKVPINDIGREYRTGGGNVKWCYTI